MSIVCWGTRGTTPSPGAGTVHYGGNTSCLEVRVQGRSLILDAGSGIVSLGRHLAAAGQSAIDLFLTHFHWDHIQGLPFFIPMFDAAATIRVHAEPPEGMQLDDLLNLQMRRPYSPVSVDEMAARVEYLPMGGRPWTDGNVLVTPFRVRHPDNAHGFRVQCDDLSVVYIPDNEPECTDYVTVGAWDDTIRTFVRGVDLLVHDAMFTESEYRHRRRWGHGTVDQAISLCRTANVRRLLLFHHHPDRTDQQLRAIEEAASREIGQMGAEMQSKQPSKGARFSSPRRVARSDACPREPAFALAAASDVKARGGRASSNGGREWH
jgi:phosphoribosyl 1,2-cyclic phosphodiesterase